MMTQIVSKDAYLLFYVKKDLNSFHRQSVSLPENWPFLQKLAQGGAHMGSPLSPHRNLDSKREIRSRVQSINKSAVPVGHPHSEKRNSVFLRRRESSVSGGQAFIDMANLRENIAARRASIVPLGNSMQGSGQSHIPVIMETIQEREAVDPSTKPISKMVSSERKTSTEHQD